MQQITVIDHPDYRHAHFKAFSSARLNAVLKNFTQKDFEESNQSYRDDRFKAVFAMAPGIDQKNYVLPEKAYQWFAYQLISQ